MQQKNELKSKNDSEAAKIAPLCIDWYAISIDQLCAMIRN
jgi:hypothetical protein